MKRLLLAGLILVGITSISSVASAGAPLKGINV